MRHCLLKVYLALFVVLSPTLSDAVKAQTIQWASSVDFVYNQFSQNEYSAVEVIGKPNAAPYGALNHKALRLNNEASFGTIVVNFDKPQKAKNVVIVESFLPGRIINIIVYDENGSRFRVYRQEAHTVEETCRILILSIPENAHIINRVEVNIDTQTINGWTQIDAIGISNESLTKVKQSLYPIGITKIVEEMSYADNRISLGPNINSMYNETRPVISPDGKILYFSRQNHPDNIRGEMDPQDIYFSEWVNGQWSPARNIGEPLNDKYANGVNSVGQDGKSLLLINEYNVENKPQTGISISYLTRSGWSFPEKVMIDDYYNYSPYADFIMSGDKKVIIMAIQRDDSYGDQDLYVSFAQRGNSWSSPVNIGNVINSSGPEFAPFLSSDGKTLYFASEGHKGYGSSDIFFSERLDNSWLNWSKPKNMGSMVNSEYWDAYYSITNNSEFAYFVSTKGSKGGSKDIFKIQLSKEEKTNPIQIIAGQVYDEKTKEPLVATVEVLDAETNEVLASTTSDINDGLYKLSFPKGNKYKIYASSIGYMIYNEPLEPIENEEEEYTDKSIGLDPIEVGNTLVMQNINFEQSQAILLTESYAELDKLLKLMLDNPNLEIELGGHTDGTGSYKLNMQLSEERVKVVKDYLVENGIAESRLQPKAYGSSKPLASNATEATRRLNRRVEIKIMKVK